jgi:ACS family sodium-dependent inorganic phosphate cotransporter
VSREEQALLLQGRTADESGESVSWKKLLRSLPVWSMVVGHFATTWTLYVLLSWLPSYFRDVQGLSIANAGLFSAAPWLAMLAVTNIAAGISDRMIRHGVSVTRARKLMQCFGLLGSAAFLLATRNADSPLIALLLLCGATGALGCAFSGYAPNGLDIAPRHAALLVGFSNTFATIPGIVGVAVTGWLVDVTGTYSAAFLLTAAVSACAALFYALCFNARPIDLRLDAVGETP